MCLKVNWTSFFKFSLLFCSKHEPNQAPLFQRIFFRWRLTGPILFATHHHFTPPTCIWRRRFPHSTVCKAKVEELSWIAITTKNFHSFFFSCSKRIRYKEKVHPKTCHSFPRNSDVYRYLLLNNPVKQTHGKVVGLQWSDPSVMTY